MIQEISDSGMPYVSFKFHELTFDKKSNEVFSEQVPLTLFDVKNGCIGTDANAEAGGITYVLSRKLKSQLMDLPSISP
ncbi:hypothetical protein EZS27_020096 [termite gut metagenome]|uniref:Uncharacterized protein n=1 Tax=termite gut metagenome TaxID=433724 RepID=A0A5J4REH7_9ZZZZ